ncbi:unnamed protein product [Discula destructiva]
MLNIISTAKLEAVTGLLDKLTVDLDKSDLATGERDAALEELKVYGRDPRDADPIFTNEGIRTLVRHAFDNDTLSTSHNALKCLANAMLIKAEARQIFVDLGYEPKACEQLKRDTWDDEFLVGRVIFLTTYGTNVDLTKLIDDYGLSDTVIAKLANHANLATTSAKGQADPMQEMALAETLKLMFNVTHFCKAKTDVFTPAISHVVTLLTKRKIASSQPLEGALSHLVNALVNLKLDSPEAMAVLYPESTPHSVVERLLHLLDLSLKTYNDENLEQTVTPLVSVLRVLHDSAPAPTKALIRSSLLPSADDRAKVLGKSDTMPARLLRNSTNALTPQLRETVSHLLFEMSDKDAHKFVDNVGYGFASGFLFQNNIPLPKNATEGASGSGRPVNPITGQFLDREATVDEGPEMTEEEKEREAERLFVLFERLRRTGVVDVQNPVEQAMREGRYNDIKDDDRVEELDD